jgi:hypothetical protein
MRRLAALLALSLLVGSTGSARAGEAGASGFTPDEIGAFAGRLQDAVRSGDATRVSSLVSFPLRINRRGTRPLAVQRAEFLRRYARIFTPEVQAAVLKQDLAAIFENSAGVMFGDGEVWAAGVCPGRRCDKGELKVIVVNAASR